MVKLDIDLIDERFSKKILGSCNTSDHESNHGEGDKILEHLLASLGLFKTRMAIRGVTKWYA